MKKLFRIKTVKFKTVTLITIAIYQFITPALQPASFAAAIIFDCDGVIIDSEQAKFEAWKKALELYHVSYTLEEYMEVVGQDSKAIKKSIELSKNIILPNSLIEQKSRHYSFLQEQGLPHFPETISFIQFLNKTLKRQQIGLALASSAPRVEINRNLKSAGLENFFDVIVSGEDDLKHYQGSEGVNKPKPYIYQETAKQLGVKPHMCIVFEDTAAGVEAAYSAGMNVIAVSNRFTKNHDFSHALCILTSFNMLRNFFAMLYALKSLSPLYGPQKNFNHNIQ